MSQAVHEIGTWRPRAATRPPDDAFRAAMPVTTYMWGCIFYMLGSICFVIGTGFYLADAVRLAAK